MGNLWKILLQNTFFNWHCLSLCENVVITDFSHGFISNICILTVHRFAQAWQQQYGDPVHPGTKRCYTTGYRPAVLLHLCVPKQPESLTSTSPMSAKTSTRPECGDVHAHGIQIKGEILPITDHNQLWKCIYTTVYQWIPAQNLHLILLLPKGANELK